MSMPSFPNPDPNLNKDQAISWILASIAMEEAALSRLIEAESEKIKWALGCFQCQNPCCDLDKVLAVNQSANDLMDSVLDMQILLKRKMQRALQHVSDPSPPCPPGPCPPGPCPPGPCRQKPAACRECQQHALFQANTDCWRSKTALPLKQAPFHSSWAVLWPLGNSKILLPLCSRLKIVLDFAFVLENDAQQDVTMELRQTIHEKILMKKTFRATGCQKVCQLLDSAIVVTDRALPQSRLSLMLTSPHTLKVQHGLINVFSA